MIGASCNEACGEIEIKDGSINATVSNGNASHSAAIGSAGGSSTKKVGKVIISGGNHNLQTGYWGSSFAAYENYLEEVIFTGGTTAITGTNPFGGGSYNKNIGYGTVTIKDDAKVFIYIQTQSFQWKAVF